MLDPAHGEFDHVVAMDSLIHYAPADVVQVLAGIAARTRASILFTFAPRTPALALMHAVGQWFPRGNRSPAIVPVGVARLREMLAAEPRLTRWQAGRTQRVAVGFYTSQALELVPA
jgi:magnesium-protoporphyrin O-methyltransferase